MYSLEDYSCRWMLNNYFGVVNVCSISTFVVVCYSCLMLMLMLMLVYIYVCVRVRVCVCVFVYICVCVSVCVLAEFYFVIFSCLHLQIIYRSL